MRMIERWFPCAEVSEASDTGWGSGQSEKALFTWFAARPLAQAKAAVLTSILPWPADEGEQVRLQDMVRKAMTGYSVAGSEIEAEIARLYPHGVAIIDPFSGRGMVPLEAAHLGVRALGLDYSPVATIGGKLLAEYPLCDWSTEKPPPYEQAPTTLASHRLVEDVQCILGEIGRRHRTAVAELYPMHDGAFPWGYLWAVTLPCQECGLRFPLVKSLILRYAAPKKGDLGQSYFLEVSRDLGSFRAIVHDGPPRSKPTLRNLTKDDKPTSGKVAICPFCDHVHSKEMHTRLANSGAGRDALLVAADISSTCGKYFRAPTPDELSAADSAGNLLSMEPEFGFELPAMPIERIPAGNNHTIQASYYGARRYSDMMNARQTLSFVRLARVISDVGSELLRCGLSPPYAAALCSYASAVLVRKLNYSTRGAVLQPARPPASNSVKVNHLFAHEASLAFSYDYF
jgi:adenine-specific DNA methylase